MRKERGKTLRAKNKVNPDFQDKLAHIFYYSIEHGTCYVLFWKSLKTCDDLILM